ncbi:MAG: ISAzo13 family transposase [Bacteroidota bacterium]
MVPYPQEIEQRMRQFYESLSEKDRRRYAGIEALKYGHGGRNYIARVLGCSRRTVSKGAKEVSGLGGAETEKRIRRPGGGRKSYQETWVDIDEKFLQVLQDHTAGNPMDETVRWTDLSVKEIVQLLRDDHAIKVSKSVVRKLLKKHNYRRRKAQKKQTMKRVPHRNEQFENIQRLKAEYETAGNPIVSMDTKKKEYLGNFYRDGHVYTLEELRTYDHDFNSFADGVIIPHSLYDMRLNVGYIQLGTSHDTSEFACDSFRRWWDTYGRLHYPDATSILVLCDGGGSNSSRHYIFKQDLQALADEIGVEIRIAHYPPYCSKYNPIEHRLFPHVTRACQGVIFTSIDVVQQLMQKTRTTTGLKVFVHILDKVYQTGREVADDFKQQMRIVHDSFLAQWNYRAIPALS